MKNKKGFTLVELLSVIFILGILLLIAIPAAQRYLNKGTKTYYQNLEKTVLLAGKEYLNDYKVLLPRVIGNVEVIELDELTSNKYIKNVVDHNNKKCKATVTVKKITESKYEYYSCLKCEGYESKSENCGFNEDDNVAAGSVDYTIKVNDYYEVEQGTDFTLPIGEVYYKEQKIAIANPRPKVIDTNTIGETKVTYLYKQAKKIVTVKVVDKTKPTKPIVAMTKGSLSGYVYTSGWYWGSIYQSFNSNDYASNSESLLGSGIDYYAVSTDGGKNYTKITGTGGAIGSVISSSGVNYLVTTKSGEYNFYVKSVDKAGNESDVTSYSFKIDSIAPSATISGTCDIKFTLTDNIGVVGYGVNQSSSGYYLSELKSINSTKNTTVNYTPTKNGTHYVWVKDVAGNSKGFQFEVSCDNLESGGDTSVATCDTNKTWTYGYTGNVEPFEAPSDGIYRLEVWGAQGFSIGKNRGGYGGYSYGEIGLKKGETIYIVVGGTSTKSSCLSYDEEDSTKCDDYKVYGGYNGGADGYDAWEAEYGGGGGGATHIAKASGLLSTLESNKSDILIVAGGGGGAGNNRNENASSITGGEGGDAGGFQATGQSWDINNADDKGYSYGTQIKGGEGEYREFDNDDESDEATGGDGKFGLGGEAGCASPQSLYRCTSGSGGGGFYGGGGACGAQGSLHHLGGGGGSGYIGNKLLMNKAMYCYNCAESNATSTRTVSTTNVSDTATPQYAKKGNGYAKITLVSCGNASGSNEPTVTVSVSGSTATFNLSDDIGVVAYGVNQSSTTEPTYYDIESTTSTTKKYVARTSGKYYVWVKDATGLTSNEEFTISSVTASNLKDTILADNNYITASPNISTTSEKSGDLNGLYVSYDTNSGDPTYFFRGNVTNNYVSFAGYKWRIVRINEDGTIRLVMEGNIGKGKIRGSDSDKNHMYYSLGTTTNHANVVLNNWYTNNIADNSTDSGKVATGNYFCEMYYKIANDPTFQCITDDNGYGLVNSSIGLLTKEEVRFAGGIRGADNTTYYLYDGKGNLTMSPGGKIDTDGDGDTEYSVWRFNSNGKLIRYSVKEEAYLRPVINLVSTVTATGSGTSDKPYVVQ